MENMKSIRAVGMCLVAAFAFGAIAAASASATNPGYPYPSNMKCVKAPKVEKKYTGQFGNKDCTEAATDGKYKLESLSHGEKFTVKSKGAAFKIAGNVVKCTKGTGEGELHGEFQPVENVVITFSKCDINENKKEPCENITTKPLHGELWYTSKEDTAAEIELGRGTFAEIKCGAKAFVVEGDVIGTVANSKSGEIWTFAVNGSGEQALQYYWENESQINTFPQTLEYEEVERVTLVATLEQKGPKGVGVFF